MYRPKRLSCDMHWEGDDQGSGIINRLDSDDPFKQPILASTDVTITTAQNLACWILQIRIRIAPSTELWHYCLSLNTFWKRRCRFVEGCIWTSDLLRLVYSRLTRVGQSARWTCSWFLFFHLWYRVWRMASLDRPSFWAIFVAVRFEAAQKLGLSDEGIRLSDAVLDILRRLHFNEWVKRLVEKYNLRWA